MRGNQATNSSNTNPICERGNEIFPFILIEVLVCLFHPSSILHHPPPLRLNSPPLPPSLSRLCKYYPEMNNFTWCWAPLPLGLFVRSESVSDSQELSICKVDKRERHWALLYNFIHTSTKKSFILILKWLQMRRTLFFCLGAEVCDNVGLN